MTDISISEISDLLNGKEIELGEEYIRLNQNNGFLPISQEMYHKIFKKIRIMARFSKKWDIFLKKMRNLYLPTEIMNNLPNLSDYYKIDNYKENNIRWFMESDFGLKYYHIDTYILVKSEAIKKLQSHIDELYNMHEYELTSKFITTNTITGAKRVISNDYDKLRKEEQLKQLTNKIIIYESELSEIKNT